MLLLLVGLLLLLLLLSRCDQRCVMWSYEEVLPSLQSSVQVLAVGSLSICVLLLLHYNTALTKCTVPLGNSFLQIRLVLNVQGKYLHTDTPTRRRIGYCSSHVGTHDFCAAFSHQTAS